MKTARFTVFALVAFSIFIILCSESLPAIAKAPGNTSFDLRVSTGMPVSIPIPLLSKVVLFFHFSVALRLYLQAWAIDVSPALNAYFARAVTFRVKAGIVCVWLFRFAWVFMLSWLPIFYDGAAKTGSTVSAVKLMSYYCTLFMLLFISDLLLYPLLKASMVESTQTTKSNAVKRLKLCWLVFDFILVVCAICLLLREFPWSQQFHIWKLILFPFLLMLMFSISIFQILFWSFEIFGKKAPIST